MFVLVHCTNLSRSSSSCLMIPFRFALARDCNTRALGRIVSRRRVLIASDHNFDVFPQLHLHQAIQLEGLSRFVISNKVQQLIFGAVRYQEHCTRIG